MPDDHLRARAVHLVADESAVKLLNDIFPAVAEEKKRREDGKQIMVPNLWNSLAKDFFNSKEWRPVNTSSDPKLIHLNPSSPPSHPYTGSQLRTLFNSLRTHYSLAQHHNEEPVRTCGSDVEFSHGNEDAITMYMHSLYSSLAPLPCMRDMKLPHTAVAPLSTRIRSEVTPVIVDLSQQPLVDEDREVRSADRASYHRDLAMEEYYRAATQLINLQARHREIEFLQSQLKTTPLSDRTRLAIETQIQTLLDALLPPRQIE